MKNKFTLALVLLLTLPAFNLSYAQDLSFNLLWQKKTSATTMKFSPDARLLITGGVSTCNYCGQLHVWRVQDGVLTTTITKETLGLTNAVDVSNDSRTILSGHGGVYCTGGGEGGDCKPAWGGLYTHSVSGKEKKFLRAGDNIYSIAYSPDNSIIAAGTGYNNTGEIRIYDSNFNLLRVLPGHHSENSETDGLAFTPDGKYLVSGGSDGNVKIWNYKTGALIRTMRHGDYLSGGTYINVDVSPNGQYIASAGKGYNMTTKVWRITDGALIYKLPVKGSYGTNIAKFSADGAYVISGTQQYKTGPWLANILIWQLSDGALIEKITDKDGAPFGGIRSMTFSPDKKYFAYSLLGKLKLFTINYSNGAVSKNNANKLQVSNASLNFAAYPNPFKSFITITYNLPLKQHVSIMIYDVYGREIALLKDEEQDAGVHNIQFNSETIKGGMYYCKLQTEKFFEIRPLVSAEK